MAINSPPIKFQQPQNCIEARGQSPKTIAFVVKSGLLQNGLKVTLIVQMHLKYDI